MRERLPHHSLRLLITTDDCSLKFNGKRSSGQQ
jgi:hypothetical protein